MAGWCRLPAGFIVCAAELSEDRVAVGVGFRDQVHRDGVARAGAVFDDDGLTHLLRNLLEHGAGHDVGGAARAKRNDRSNCFLDGQVCADADPQPPATRSNAALSAFQRVPEPEPPANAAVHQNVLPAMKPMS